MATMPVNRNAQRSLFSQEEMHGKSTMNGSNAKSMNLQEYIHSRDGLWRLLTCMPQGMSVVEALALAPSVIFGLRQQEKGGAL